VSKRLAGRGLFVGRFQPFHKGHLHGIHDILREVDELIIAVGSAQFSHTIENPFTAGERIEMIRRALSADEVDPSKYMLMPVADVNVHSLWVPHVRSLVPHFDVVFSNKPLVKMLFAEAGFNVQPFNFYHREEYSATEIRKKIIQEDESWKDLVPREVAKFIESIKGDERLRTLATTDSAGTKVLPSG
jgi:nicotinamide-nucleotide adenylyltransferase